MLAIRPYHCKCQNDSAECTIGFRDDVGVYVFTDNRAIVSNFIMEAAMLGDMGDIRGTEGLVSGATDGQIVLDSWTYSTWGDGLPI